MESVKKSDKFIIEDRSKSLKIALNGYGKSWNDLKEDLTIIIEWVKTQPHLPEMPSDEMIIFMLIANKFSIEKTKEKIDVYYTIRGILPEIYESANPKSVHMQTIMNSIYIFIIPKLTKEGYRISYGGVCDEDFNKFDFNLTMSYGLNVLELLLLEDINLGVVVIQDYDKLSVGHILKCTPMLVKKLAMVMQKVVATQLKQVHIVNAPSYAEKVVNLLKNFLPAKLRNRFFVHSSLKTLKDHISAELLPIELGGTCYTRRSLHEITKQKFIEYQDRFDILDKLRTDESKRPTPLVNDDFLGYYGNFKKINVD